MVKFKDAGFIALNKDGSVIVVKVTLVNGDEVEWYRRLSNPFK